MHPQAQGRRAFSEGSDLRSITMLGSTWAPIFGKRPLTVLPSSRSCSFAYSSSTAFLCDRAATGSPSLDSRDLAGVYICFVLKP